MYNTLTITQFVDHFSNTCSKNPRMVSHATKLLKHRSLHELLQHAQTVYNHYGLTDYYHISDVMMGYAAFSFNTANFYRIFFRYDINSVTFHEKKMIMGNAENYNKIIKIIKKYSFPQRLATSSHGCRPISVGHLEFGSFTKENHNILNCKLKDTPVRKRCNVLTENYSDFFAQIEINPKHGGLGEGTVLTNLAFQRVAHFFNYLQSHHKMCLFMNEQLSLNPRFPLPLPQKF
jgi:hypothetical protein